MSKRQRVIILGAAGMDFHTFNCCYRDNKGYEVVAFTATQIPDIHGREYPKELAGSLYPNGIPIHKEEDLQELIKKHNADICILAYSDLKHETVMHKASLVIGSGPSFGLKGTNLLCLKAKVPVISICAVRTGVGKSQTTRKVAELLKAKGIKTVAVRHPMPYGDLRKQICQRYEKHDDLLKYETTIEEREEYEPHIDNKVIVYAGVDYHKILAEAEKEADVILWDGGNNDIPFFKSDLHIVLADGKRAGHEVGYHPGEANFRMADVIIINKIRDSKPEDVELIKKNAKEVNPNAKIILASSKITVDKEDELKGKKVLVVEDGPSTTHGDLNTGAATIIANKLNLKKIDPKPFAVGSIKETFDKFPHLVDILPAMGYGDKQIKDLEETINKADCDVVLSGTPIDLSRIISVKKPVYRVKYDYEEMDNGKVIDTIVEKFIQEKMKSGK